MNSLTKKRQLVHTPIKCLPTPVKTEPSHTIIPPQPSYGAEQIQRKVESLVKREDVVYSLANKLGQLESQARAQDSSNYIYEQSLREAQKGAENFYEEQVQSLENDKLNLMRRLNIVLVKLEKLVHEKDELSAQIANGGRVAQELITRLDQAEDGTGFFSNKLKEDIAITREQNAKLKAEISKREKEILNVDGFPQEEILQQYKEKTKIMRQQLFSTEDTCKDLQDKQEQCVAELKILVEQTEELVNHETAGERDKEDLNNLLSKLTGERNDLIFRMNTLTEKYDQYVREMAKEREDIMIVNKSRQRMLASSILFTRLLKQKAQRLRLGLGCIKHTADYLKEAQRRIIDLAKWQDTYKLKLINLAFQKWKHNNLKWIEERTRNEILLVRERARRQRAMVFSLWQSSFRSVAGRKDTQTEIAHRIFQLSLRQQDKDLRTSFGHWYKFASNKACRDLYLKRILLRLLKSNEQTAFFEWLTAVKQRREKEQLKLLADLTAEEKFKRQMFSQLRHNIYLNEDMKSGQAQLVLDKRQREKQKARYIKTATILLMTMNRRKDQGLEEEVLHSIKFNQLAEQKERTNKILEKEIPDVETLQKSIQDENVNQMERVERIMLNTCLLAFKRKLNYYFERWRNVIPVYIHNSARLKRILKRFAIDKIGSAFNNWRHKAHEKGMKQEKIDLETRRNRIESLDEAVNELGKELDKHKDHMANYTLSKLERIAHIIARRYMHNKITQWKKTTIKLNNIETAGQKLNRMINKHVLANHLNNFRNWNKHRKEEIGNKNKIESINLLTKQNIIRKTFTTFRNQINSIKEIKNNLRKFFRDKDNEKLRELINRWRKKAHTIIKETVKSDIEKILDNTDTINKELELAEKSKKRLIEDVKDLANSESKKALTTIFKNFLVHHNNRMLAAFRIWRNNVAHSKALTNLLIRYIKKKEHNMYRLALANWLTKKHAEHMSAVDEERKQQVNRHNTFSKLTTLKLGETEGELKELKEIYNNTKNQYELDTKKIEATTGILNKLNRFYIGLPIDHNFFLVWSNMVQREKELQGRAKRIMQVFTGKYIYSKLKQNSHENSIRNETDKKLTKMLKVLKRNWMRRGFQSMRIGKRTRAEEEQNIDKQDQELILEQTQNSLEVIYKRSRVNNEKEIIRRRLLKNFLAWKKQAKLQKLLKHRTQLLNDEIKIIRIGGSFRRWHDDFDFIQTDRDKTSKAAKHHDTKIHNKTIKSWYRVYKSEVTLPKLLEQIAKRQHIYDVGYALEKLEADTKQKDQKEQSHKEMASLKLSILLTNIISNSISNSFSTLVQYSTKRKLDREYLRRILLKLFLKKVSYAFNSWRLKAEKYKLIDEIEAKGETAKAAHLLAQKHSSTKKLLSVCGLQNVHRKNSILRFSTGKVSEIILESQPKEEKEEVKNKAEEIVEGSLGDVSPILSFEEFKEIPAVPGLALDVSFSPKKQRIDTQEAITRKFIVRWMGRLTNNELTGVYVSMWRRIINVKKNVKMSSEFILKRISSNEKGWAFNKLRNLKRAGLKTFEKVSRDNLLRQILTNSNDLAKLEDEANKLNQQLQKAANRKEILAENIESGKTLVITVIKCLVNKPIHKALLQWKLKIQQAAIADMQGMLRDKLISFERLQQINRELEIQNNNLLSENEDLRHSSIDGLEIANTIQRITQEREQLSVDLLDRSRTIKTLLAENVLIQSKLNKVKEAADKLIELANCVS